MRDYSKYEKTPVMFSGAEKKFEIIIDGHRYIVKFQKNSEVGLTYNYVSEYLGSHIFQSIGIPVQETFLGTYDGKNVVVMKNFLEPEDALVAFNGVGESSLERDKELYQYTYEDITSMLTENMKSTNVAETIERFWDMFIVDALIGNFDRHGGNWGFIKRDNKYRIAPVYDNGSSLYPKLNTDEKIAEVLASQHGIVDLLDPLRSIMPCFVNEMSIGRHGIDLAADGTELLVLIRQILQLRGTYKGKVRGIEEKDTPFSEDIFFAHKLKFIFVVGIGAEIRNFLVDHRHICFLH